MAVDTCINPGCEPCPFDVLSREEKIYQLWVQAILLEPDVEHDSPNCFQQKLPDDQLRTIYEILCRQNCIKDFEVVTLTEEESTLTLPSDTFYWIAQLNDVVEGGLTIDSSGGQELLSPGDSALGTGGATFTLDEVTDSEATITYIFCAVEQEGI